MFRVLFIVMVALLVLTVILPSFFNLKLIWMILLLELTGIVTIFTILFASGAIRIVSNTANTKK